MKIWGGDLTISPNNGIEIESALDCLWILILHVLIVLKNTLPCLGFTFLN